MKFLPSSPILLRCASVAATVSLAAAEENVDSDFNRDIRPILSDKCFHCHGPDEKERKGGERGLRLDTAEGALEDLGGYRAIVPGKPDESEVIKRLLTDEKDDLMPPAKSGKKVTAREIDLLERWIAAGAKYARHWAYEKPRLAPLPEVKDKSWARGPLDQFVLARLEREGLAPQPEADRFALARRVALDLTGLPPAIEEVDAFVSDIAPDAYERYVDRQLAKPSYGEHWARAWLDLARYADSKGYADDQTRSIWRYRDYVIRAFNANMPFDQFTIEQIAGDLLPNPTQDQLVATAFHRNTMTNTEGGTTDEEFRNAAIVDRVDTTMAVWMGTSMACAQCHTHKFDPLSQKEYFQVFAFFNNTEDSDRADEEPLLKFYTVEQQSQRKQWDTELAELEKKLIDAKPGLVASAETWAGEFPAKLEWLTLQPAAAKSEGGATLTTTGDGGILAADGRKTDTYTIEFPINEARKITALRLEALPHDSLPGKGPGRAAGNFVVTRVRASVVGPRGELKFTEAIADFSQNDYDEALVISDQAPRNPKPRRKRGTKNGWAIGGAVGKPHTLSLVTAEPLELAPGGKLIVTIEQKSNVANATLGHFRIATNSEPRVSENLRTPSKILSVLQRPAAERAAPQSEQLIDYYVRNVAPELKAEQQRIAVLRRGLDDMPINSVPIMRELGEKQRRKTHIQTRGNYLALAGEVAEGVPAVWHAVPAGAPMNRLTLAKWLVDENNPLTARVVANRFWEAIFGMGLVRTSEEFGAQGELPSHPELLDWLALQLVEHKWDTKRFLGLLVTSASYRQSSKVIIEALERDSDNRLLSRGPRFRLAAETVRDQALAVSGLLSAKMFGPSVRPLQPAFGLSAAFGSGLDWKTSEGSERHRRGIYTEWRRSNPYPSMITFDATSREVCTLRRNPTNTPLQALVTLNDPVYVEAAQALARRMASRGPGAEEKLRHGFRLILARPPAETELRRLLELHADATVFYAQDAKKAAELATNPLGPAPPGADLADLAAWTSVANVLLNLDETLMKR
ncbi:MAG: PSD1 and planctomycete cytochrome C domain-containing protein [Verrucomicrobiota bacterium]|nr:PSD1 and planctomycete cytochrome C domain-containing protein [Verrucomicrobiota bacterium]